MKALRNDQIITFLVLFLLLVSACGRSSLDTSVSSVDVPPVSYLEETIPPCTPFEHKQQDPCQFETVSHVDSLSATGTLFFLKDRRPNFSDVLNGTNGLALR